MNIELKKYGTTLVFRERGQEAYKALQAIMPKEIPESENVVVDFSGVVTFSPSWGDEFLTPLHTRFGKRLLLTNTSNSSVKASLDILTATKKIEFNIA